MDFDGDIALNDNASTPPVAVNTAPAPAAVTEPTANPEDLLPKTDYDLLAVLVGETHGINPDVVKSLTTAFEQYPDTKGTAMSQAITTWGHCFFVQKYPPNTMNDLLDTTIENLRIIANTNHDHFLYERRYSECISGYYLRRELVQPMLLTENESVRAEASKQWTLPNG